MSISLTLRDKEARTLLRAISIAISRNKKDQRRSERKGLFPPEGGANIYDINDATLRTIREKIRHEAKNVS